MLADGPTVKPNTKLCVRSTAVRQWPNDQMLRLAYGHRRTRANNTDSVSTDEREEERQSAYTHGLTVGVVETIALPDSEKKKHSAPSALGDAL